jgi:limonene-1,2-epoxide hydrolase
MNSQQPIDVIKAFLKVMETNDIDTAVQFVDDNLVYINVPFGFEAGTVHGPDGMRSVLEPAFAKVIRNEFIIKNVSVDGETVFLERLDRHQLPNGWAELPVVGVFKVTDGKISEWRDYFDMSVFVAQMEASS